MRIRFWGTRGSIAKPGASTLRYGGNTACVEVRAQDGTLIVIDCGTGVHALGQALVASGERPLRGHLLISHTHWDHIQGFPFFAPLFVPGNEWDIYAPGGGGGQLEGALSGQMEFTYFPIALEQLGATIRCHDLREGQFIAGGVQVTTRYLNHPAVTLGYRLEAGGVTLVYVSDHESHAPSTADATQGDGLLDLDGVPIHAEDRQHVEFLRGADLVIHDAQYTLEEYAKKRGWGHTPVEQAVTFGQLAGVKQMALFHHDPLRDDDAVDRLVERARQRAATTGLVVFAAAEGLQLDLAAPAVPAAAATVGNGSVALAGGGSPVGEELVLVVDDDPEVLTLLAEVLEQEGLRILLAGDGDAALSLARTARPDLILLDWQMPGRDGLEVLRALRAEDDEHVRDLPVVLLTARAKPRDAAAGFEAGATDYLTKPFTPALVRSRVRAWLQRTRAGGPETAGDGD